MWADDIDEDQSAGAAEIGPAGQRAEEHPKRVRFSEDCKGADAVVCASDTVSLFTHLLNKIPPEILINVLVLVGTTNGACLVAIAQLSAQWSSLAEEAFRTLCTRARWRLPRVPRGPSAASLRPWRTLFLSHQCHACHNRGEYPVLNARKQQVALLCLGCTASERVHNFLSAHLYTLQTVSIEGRDLPATREKKKRRRIQNP